MEKKGLDILSNTFKPEWRDILSRTPEGVKETSLALLKKHKDDALMDLQPIVLTQIVGSSEGVGAVLTEFVAGHPDQSILDVPRYLRRAMEKTGAGQTAVVEALIEKYPDVLNAPKDVQRKLSKSVRGRDAVSEALIKQHPDVLNCVEIKILRRVRAESSRRPPRHRRDACSMAWRCRFLAARPSQVGRVIAEK